MSSENKLSQKEYLKRYLSNDKDEKKKKKRKVVSSSTVLKRSQIIDDDIDLKNMRVLDDDEVELYQLDEDAPQIAGIVDERPPEVQAMEYYGNKKRWKVFGADNGDGDELMIRDSFDDSKEILRTDKSQLIRGKSLNKNVNSDLELPRKQRKHENDVGSSSFYKSNKESSSKHKSRHSGSDSDLSPPRSSGNKNKQKSKSNRSDDSDLSPPRTNSTKKRYKNDDSDLSPPRRSNKSSVRKSEKPSSGSDLSPPRRTKSSAGRSYRKNSDSDLSPPRRSDKSTKKKAGGSDSDLSLPRRSDKFTKKKADGNSDSDLSPPRRSVKHERKTRHFKDSDFSPPRKDRAHLNSRKYKNGSDSDLSPPRRNHDSRRRDEDKHNLHKKDSGRYYKNSKEPSNISYHNKDRRKYENSGNSSDSDRRGDASSKFHSSKGKGHSDLYNSGVLANSKDSKSSKMTKTLEGKQAGLQNAKQLKKELSDFKEREDQLFSKLSSDLSGRGAATVMRDRKTGKRRDLEKERSDALEKAEKSAEQNEKYSRWGRGLKQVEDAAERAASAIHEMSKPLARYADDDDLDKFLKAQEREGDPMLDYIRQKQSESISLTESKPMYKGSFLPNRFGIRPGYRWDGVDRSNGYEKQWFTTQNNRKARDEEAYKWSTSDM